MTNDIRKIMTLREASIQGWASAISKSKLVRSFIEHEPYTPTQIAEANKLKKPLMKFGVLVSKLMALEGQELANRRGVVFEPRYPSANAVVEILQQHWEYLCQREMLHAKLVKAMSSGLCYPILGWIRRIISTDDTGYLTYTWENVDSFLVHPDPTFERYDLSDCDYIVIDEYMTMQQINTIFKPKQFTDSQIRYAFEQIQGRNFGNIEHYYGAEKCIDGDRHLVCQLEERVHVHSVVVTVNGVMQNITQEEADKLSNDGNKVEHITDSTCTRIRMTTCLPSHNVIIQKDYLPLNNGRFSLFCCGSYDWAMQKRYQPSLMYILTDVQDSLSKTKSQYIDFMRKNLQDHYVISRAETQAQEDLERGRGEPHSVIRMNNIQNIQKLGSQHNVAALNAMQDDIYTSLNFMSEISNITPSMEGKGGKSGESGALFEAKVQRGLTGTNPYYEQKAFCNLRIAQDYLETVGTVYFEDDRLLEKKRDNITGLHYDIINMKYGDITINDVRTAKLLAVLDEGDSTPLKRDSNFNMSLAMIQTMLNAGFPPDSIDWVHVIENSNLPNKPAWIRMAQEGMSVQDMLAEENFANNKVASTYAGVPNANTTSE